MCAGCRRDLPMCLSACPRCALPGTGGETCGRCLKRPPAFDGTTALFSYDYPVDRLIQRLKYASDFGVADALAQYVVGAVARPSVDVIVPVPLHPARLAERGFNQAVEIARPLAQAWEIALVTRGVARLRRTDDQVGLALSARRKNLRHAFSCEAKLDGARVLIIDDVMTTGATLDALALCLKRAGAASVCNLVIARTPLR
ncbi:ComF family protein [Denitromonas sp. IR12]|uniref:ComF family protein n=1 Tax=Denitromonas iodatirespirans TaxID=2795389 RepID=A0A944D8W7_DENI1|nr:ComF family protein [Denitromonas iodatirespirans]